MPPRDPRANENGPPAGSSPPAKKNWRGTAPAGQTVTRHRWQRDWTKEQDVDVQRRNMRHRVKVVAMWALFLGLTLWLAYYLFFPARLTPFVPIAVTQYDFPVPPNAFAREDVNQFKDLDRESLRIVDGTIVEEKDWNRNWRNVSDGMNRLRSLLRDALPLGSKQVIVIYLSMHGMVDLDERNQPRACLLPPTGGSNKEWLPVSDVFELLATDEFKDRKKLLVLDAHRLESDWHLGQLYNGFGAAFETAFKAAEVPNLAVLAAASPGEIAWSSPEMARSNFGRFFSDGLHGQADGFGPGNSPDGEITLGELTDYVRTQCDAWASENRVDHQSPYLLSESSSNARDWTVAQPSSNGLLAWLGNWFDPSTAATSTEPPAEPPADTREELTDFWRDHRDLEQAGAIQLDPLAWQQFERRLLWGEQLAAAGQDPNYVKFNNDNLGELARLTALLRPAPQENPASTIPLAELLGGESKGLAPAQAAWKNLLDSGVDRGKVNATLDKIKQDSPAALDFSEIQFLRLLSTHLNPDDWSNPVLIESILHLRDRAEVVAAPADIRVAPWVEPGVTAADESRRLAEDKLFIGGKGQGQGPQNDTLRAEDLYQRTQELGALMSEAYRLRDHVAAKVPYLAAWLSRRLPSALEVGKQTAYTKEYDSLLKTDFLPLLAQYRTFSLNRLDRLDENLADVPTLEKRMQLVSDEMNSLRVHFNKLQDAFINECQDLKVLAGDNGKNDTDKLRRLAAVLSVPLIDAQDRADLRANYELISQTRANAWQAQDQSNPEAAQPDALQLNRLRSWEIADHPAISLLRAALPEQKDVAWDTAGSDRFTDLARQGALLRQRLSLSMQGIDSLATSGVADGITQFRQKSDLADGARARVGFSQSDHILRTTAALGPAIDPQQENPIALLHAFDRCYLLRWHARRAMDDFYGSPGNQEDFFETAANRYLESAKAELNLFCGNDAPAMTERALLEKRQTAAAEIARFPLAAELEDSSGDINHQLNVTPGPDLPTGQIAVFLERESEEAVRLLLVRSEVAGAESADYRPSIPTVPSSEFSDGHYDLNYSIRQADPDKNELRDVKVDAVAYLRGHFIEEQLLSDPLLIEFRPPDYVPPNILVTSAEQKRIDFMFIFDCSGSMSFPSSSGIRFDVALNVLFGVDNEEGILDRLVGTGLYRVGLRVYGHRVGQDPKNPQQVRRNPAILKLFPNQWSPERYKKELEGVRLGTDVDQLLPINNFTQIELQEIEKLFYSESFKPLGITPLYYSIVQALEHDFQPGSNASDRRIVVLTDGNDQQSLDKGLPAADKVDADKLRAEFDDYNTKHRGREVRLDIVGFDIPEGNVLRTIADASDGEYLPASNFQELKDRLEQVLELSNYNVLPPEGEPIGPGDFGRPLSIALSPRKRTPFKVRVNNKSTIETDVELEGGEAIELELTDVPELVHKRYDDELRDTAEKLFNPDAKVGPREIFLGSHQPAAQQAEERRFFVSVQNQDAKKFSPRPAEVWAEITPILPDSTAPVPTYTFFDAYFEPRRPVPVLAFEVPRWPADAVEAEVKFWCKYTRTEKDHEEKVADVANQPNLALEKRSIPKLPGVTFEVNVKAAGDPDAEGAEVTVKVTQTGAPREPVKVEMIPSPDAVKHQYFYSDSKQTVQHHFYFNRVTQKELLDRFNGNYFVRFTSAENLKQGAITSAEPFQVDIPRD